MMTLANLFVMAVMLVLFSIYIREWLHILSHYPVFVVTVLFLAFVNWIGPHFVETIETVLKAAAGILAVIFIAAAFEAVRQLRNENVHDGN